MRNLYHYRDRAGAVMTIDLEALAYVMHVTLDIEQDGPTSWGCSLRGVSIKEATTDDTSTPALATGRTREIATDNLAQMLRGKIACKLYRVGKEFFDVPSSLMAGIK